ncbi:MAG: DUF4124 domain-containing protein [Nevskia sp.]|nr:DUF4124 domain-containing protein [Nevskia sp.]
MRKISSAARGGLLAAAALLLSGAVLAQQSSPSLYRWVDKDGHVHYGDTPGTAGAKPINPNLLNSGEDATAGAGQRSAAAEKMADCKRRGEEYTRYKDAGTITETDALGKTRSYTPEEMDKVRERKRQDLVDHCGADAVPAAAAPAAAPAPAPTTAAAPQS